MAIVKKIPTVSNRIHPLLAGAAVATGLLCVVATAAIAGWLPGGVQDDAPFPALGSATPAPSPYASSPEATPIATPLAAPDAAPAAAPAPARTLPSSHLQRTAQLTSDT
ncbi:MAG: hypothetical protein V4724_15035 [Pseudomonadota bacterium]